MWTSFFSPVKNERRQLTERLVHIGVLGVAALLLIWRCFVGMGTWGDEPYGLSTTLRYCLGDRPLVDSWDTNFSSAILAIPFVRLYLFLVGSTDGILLAYRGVFLVLSLGTALMGWFALKDLVGKRLAVVVTTLLILYFPFLSPFVGYGGDWLWHMIAAFTALRLFVHSPKHAITNMAPGFLSALAIIGNPPTVTVVPFFAAALWFTHSGGPGRDPRPAVGWYLSGVAVVGTAFVLALRVLSGPQMLSLFSEVSNPDDHDFGLYAQAYRLWEGRWILGLPLCIGALTGILQRTREHRWETICIPTTLLLSLSAGLAAVATHRTSLLVAPQVLVFIAAGSFLFAGFVSRNRSMLPAQVLLVLPAVGAGLGWFLGSNGGVASAVYPAPLMFAAAVMPWPQLYMTVAPSSLTFRLIWGSTSVLLVLLVGAVAGIGLRYTPEGVTTSMTARVREGPFKGIFATPQESVHYREMLLAIRELPPRSGRTVFIERYPLGYLIDGHLPGTYSTWATSSTSNRLDDYIDLTGNIPSRIIVTKFSDDLNDGEFQTSAYLFNSNYRYINVYQDANINVFDVYLP